MTRALPMPLSFFKDRATLWAFGLNPDRLLIGTTFLNVETGEEKDGCDAPRPGELAGVAERIRRLYGLP